MHINLVWALTLFASQSAPAAAAAAAAAGEMPLNICRHLFGGIQQQQQQQQQLEAMATTQ